MILSDRIAEVVKYSKLSIPKFAVFVGFKTPQTVRELLKGNTKTLSDAVQYKITSAYPEINKDWLITGDGEMLRGVIGTEGARHETEPTVPVGECCSEIASRFLKLLEKKDEQIERKDEQIDRLLALLEAAGRGR